jgi:hypothetical protein
MAFLTKIAGSVIVLAALLYAAGWAYLHAFYQCFGVQIFELSIPWYTVLLYALRVAFPDVLWGSLSILIIIGLVSGAEWLKVYSREYKQTGVSQNDKHRICRAILRITGPGLVLAALLIIGCALYYRGWALGREWAERDLWQETTSLPSVQISFSKADDNPDRGSNIDPRESLDRSFAYVLLTRASQRTYVFLPLLGGSNIKGTLPSANVDVESIPDSEIRTVYLRRSVTIAK